MSQRINWLVQNGSIVESGIRFKRTHHKLDRLGSYRNQAKRVKQPVTCKYVENSAQYRRRELLWSAAVSTELVLLSSLCTPTAQAVVKIDNPNGEGYVNAYELPVKLRLVVLQGSMPSNWAPDFRKTQAKKADLEVLQKSQLLDIFKELQLQKTRARERRAFPDKKVRKRSKKNIGDFDAATLGDAWLAPAIHQGLLAPLSGALSTSWWASLPPRMQQIARRNSSGALDPQGQVYGVPYRWGCTLFAFRKDKLRQRGIKPPSDWSDLWAPELKGRVAMVDAPREVVGAALKSVGLKYNTPDIQATGKMAEVGRRLEDLSRQVRMFNSKDSLKALAAGEVWLVVGWSQELLSAALKNSNVSTVFPASGTSLWADMWVTPAEREDGRQVSPLLSQWIDFSLQDQRIPASRGLRGGATPFSLVVDTPQMDCSQNLGCNSELSNSTDSFDILKGGMPSSELLNASEFLQPLTPVANNQYQSLIESMRVK